MSQKPVDQDRSDPNERPRLRFRLLLGGAATIIAACIAAAILLLSSGASNAFAGWVPTPSLASAATLATAREACGTRRPPPLPQSRGRELPATSVLAAESTGPFTAVVYEREGMHWQCVTDGRNVLLNQVPMGLPGTLTKPLVAGVEFPLASRVLMGAARARQITLMAGHLQIRDPAKAFAAVARSPDSLQVVSGHVGRGVRRVTFVLRDGARVRATIGHGWYLAWWPTNHSKLYANAPASILVTTAHGTSRAPYSSSRLLRYFRLCLLVLC
jgi:hypothetical protein